MFSTAGLRASGVVAVVQQHAPLLVAITVLAATYLFIQRIKSTGQCPFAGPRAGPSAQKGTAGKPAAMSGAAAAAGAEGGLRLTRQQLAEFDGSDANKPLYIAVRGKIYDVSAGRSFYGPGGPYAVFAGKECARALAFMKVTPEDCSDDLTGATEAQLQTLADWEAKFMQKYGIAGLVVPA